MKKLFFIIASLCLVIVASSAAYYFFSYLPKAHADQLALEKQKFEYQKQKDEQARSAAISKQAQSSIQFDQKMQQDNYNNAKARCEQESDNNYQNFQNLISQCKTTDCPQKEMAIPGVVSFGTAWIQSCIQKELSL